MTEETLKCPFCEEELLEIDKHKKIYDCQGKIQLLNLTLDCIAHDLYLQGWEDLVYKFSSIKQKAYNEGYNRGMAEWVELTTRQTSEKVEQQVKHDLEIVNKIAELKKYWIKEGRKQVLAELKKELE